MEREALERPVFGHETGAMVETVGRVAMVEMEEMAVLEQLWATDFY